MSKSQSTAEAGLPSFREHIHSPRDAPCGPRPGESIPCPSAALSREEKGTLGRPQAMGVAEPRLRPARRPPNPQTGFDTAEASTGCREETTSTATLAMNSAAVIQRTIFPSCGACFAYSSAAFFPVLSALQQAFLFPQAGQKKAKGPISRFFLPLISTALWVEFQ